MKKGFTLIELIAVILILGIIALIAIPMTSNIIQDAKEGSAKVSTTNYVKEVENQIALSSMLDGGIQDGIYSVLELEELGVKVKNSPTNGYVTITNGEVTNSSLEFNGIYVAYDDRGVTIATENIMPIEFVDGEVVYFNPVTGRTCSDYNISNSEVEVKTGCMKWYAFNDSKKNSKVNLLLDHNTTEMISWSSIEDVSNGPDVLLAKLATDTALWSDTLVRNDTYRDRHNAYSINYSGYKARLLSLEDVAEIINYDITIFPDDTFVPLNGAKDPTTYNVGENPYAWLFSLNFYAKNYGGYDIDYYTGDAYWLSSIPSTSAIDSSLLIDSSPEIQCYYQTDPDYAGIRPVITVDKNVIKKVLLKVSMQMVM